MAKNKIVVSVEITNLLNAGTIVKVISYKHDKNRKPYRMLFSDEKTILEFIEQDPYTYHDCNSSAYAMRVFQDHDTWLNNMISNDFVLATGLD